MNDLALYYAHRSFFHFGDLLQWHSDSLVGSLIRLRTREGRPVYEKEHCIDVNHSSLLVTMPYYEGAARRVWTTEAAADGTVLHLLSRDLSDYDGKLWWYPLKDDIGTDEFRRKVGTAAFRFIGRPYDYFDLLGQIAGSVHIDPNDLFCSEYCQLCYLSAMGLTLAECRETIALNPNEMPYMDLFKEPILIYDKSAALNVQPVVSQKEA
jgi:hypothetical protein